MPDAVDRMRLSVLLPTEVLLDETVIKVNVEAGNGEYCLEPRHIDFVAALVPGVLAFCDKDGRESFVAVDEGVLVKCGQDVLVSVLNGVRGTELGELRALIDERFLTLDDEERKARTALARLEAGAFRLLRDMREPELG